MLRRVGTDGGTNPVPGVNNALKLAKDMADNRFSHIILITDLNNFQLNSLKELRTSLANSVDEFALAASTITVDEEGLIALHAQFDGTVAKYIGVSRNKFEKDLFETERSSCNYTSQPYHYNPSRAFMQTHGKKMFVKGLRKFLGKGVAISVAN